MGGHQGRGELNCKFVVAPQCILNILWKASMGSFSKQCALMGVSAGSYGDTVRISNFPYSVVLQPPEWCLRMYRPSMRSEGSEQFGKFPVRFPIRHKAFFTAETTPNRPQNEKRLVGCALAVGSPEPEFPEARKQMFRVHECQDETVRATAMWNAPQFGDQEDSMPRLHVSTVV